MCDWQIQKERDKKYGRVSVDQIDYRLCQIRQMDDVGVWRNGRVNTKRMKTEQEHETRLLYFSRADFEFSQILGPLDLFDLWFRAFGVWILRC